LSIRPPVYATFSDAYVDVLSEIVERPEYANAPRGNDSIEILGASFRLADPRARLPFYATRRVNPVYDVAEVLWYLAGREDTGMLAHYAPVRRADSAKGVPVDEGAYGPRLFRRGPDGRSVFDKAISLLRTEADTKRAVLPVYAAADLDDPGAPSVPCLIALHLLLRERRLHMVVNMRANDADRGLLADVHSFTFIQELAARLLGAELGTYTHHVGSLHLATADLPRVHRVLAEHRDVGPVRFAPLEMPVGASWEDITAVLEFEARLRDNSLQLTPAELAEIELDPYWRQMILLLEVYRQIYYNPYPVERDVLIALDPGLRYLVERRWPEWMPEQIGARS
jgi:thymidylate synthase